MEVRCHLHYPAVPSRMAQPTGVDLNNHSSMWFKDRRIFIPHSVEDKTSKIAVIFKMMGTDRV